MEKTEDAVMKEAKDFQEAYEKLLTAFDESYEDSCYKYSRVEYIDEPWSMWKAGLMVYLFSSENILNICANKTDILKIKDNENYVLFRYTWHKHYISHVTYMIFSKSKMTNNITEKNMRDLLYKSKKPSQIMFTTGVKDSCSLRRS